MLLGVAGFLATAQAYAYRTGEDSPALADRGRVAWSAPRVGFSMSASNLPAGITQSQMEQALASALDAWTAPECSVVEPYFAGWITEPAAAKDGVNTISWVADWSGAGFPTLSPGTTVMQYHGHDGVWEVADADVYLDAEVDDWTTVEGKGTSLQAVLTHELGHALGLLHPCEPNGDDGAPDCKLADAAERATTMYPFYDAGQASLDSDDVAGICYLYPIEGACPGGCGRNEMCLDGVCRAFCHEKVCATGETCGYWGCVDTGSCTERYCEGQPCDVTADCGPLARCEDHTCKTGSARWGDGCTVSSDCTRGACVEGVCQPDCLFDGECGPSGTCVATKDDTAKGCTSSRAYQPGLHCAAGEDCRSGICIFTANPSVCTETCTTSATCLEGWSCGSVEGRQVCVPPTVSAAGGCALTSQKGAPVGRLGWVVLGASVLALALRRKRLAAP